MIKCAPQYELFAWLAKMITGSGNYVANQGEMVESFLGQYLKYHLDEHETFRELYTTREQMKNSYIKNQRAVIIYKL